MLRWIFDSETSAYYVGWLLVLLGIALCMVGVVGASLCPYEMIDVDKGAFMRWCGVVWCMVWYGMVWYGTVWYGTVWYSMAQAALAQAGSFVITPQFMLGNITDV